MSSVAKGPARGLFSRLFGGGAAEPAREADAPPSHAATPAGRSAAATFKSADASAGALANANAAVRFVDAHLAAGRAAKPAFVEAERELSYGALAAQSERMIEFFARAGAPRESRAAMIVLDVIEFPVIFWGALKAGVTPVPLNTLLSAEQYRYILDDCRARVLFVSAALLPVVQPILGTLPALERVYVVGAAAGGAEAGGHESFAAALEACAEPGGLGGSVSAKADDEAFWLYSSGSTGEPKGVRHVHGALGGTADTYGAEILGLREDDVVYSVAKLFFAYGLGNAMTFPMSVGATTALFAGRPTPEAVFDVMKRTRPTVFYGVPTLYAALLAAAGATRPEGAERLRLCVSAGEALPEDVGVRWRALFGVDILDGVGSTEMLHIFVSNASGDVVYGTSGRAVPGYEVRLVDEVGAEPALGEIGEMLVKGETAADGYWRRRDKTRATFEGAWTRTGDKYFAREDGRFVYCGRTDDMFKVSGIWVSPFEVESALVAHPSVLEAAIVPVRDGDGLEKPKAYVILNEGVAGDRALYEELKEHVKGAIGQWKYPRWIEFVDTLPKTATGKIQRFKLRGH